jgi:hypothetical protein
MSVVVTPSSVIEASIFFLFCVFMTRVSQCPINLRAEHPIEVNMYLLLHTKHRVNVLS